MELIMKTLTMSKKKDKRGVNASNCKLVDERESWN